MVVMWTISKKKNE